MYGALELNRVLKNPNSFEKEMMYQNSNLWYISTTIHWNFMLDGLTTGTAIQMSISLYNGFVIK